MSRLPAVLLALAAAFTAVGATTPQARKPPASEVEKHDGRPPGLQLSKSTTSDKYGPERASPVKRGEFAVNLVVIAFPDCVNPVSAEYVRDSLSHIQGMPIEDYYKEYSRNTTWPRIEAYDAIYMAPQPLGWYCVEDGWNNSIGFKSRPEGLTRAAKLRDEAFKYVKKHSKKRLPGNAFICWVYCMQPCGDQEIYEKFLRAETAGRPYKPYPPKPSKEAMERGIIDPLSKYAPSVPWKDPLWPNSIPQVKYPGDGGTIAHEIGHRLGAPDFYHATEPYDGVGGDPCLAWRYGPMGPGWVRFIYHAFLPASMYPKIDKPGEYTLAPRAKTDSTQPLGLLIQTSHPNYLLCVEYCHEDKAPLGNQAFEGLIVYAINTTLTSPMLGPPDLCYAYRRGDPWHKGEGGGSPFLKPGDSFDEKSDPAAVLPNLLPAGVAIKNISLTPEGDCKFTVEFPETSFSKEDLEYSLLPQTHLEEITELFPTSFRASMDVRYRGEPLLTEYGFCYGKTKNPDEKTGTLFPLFHRDRYDARILGLEPGTVYYVRTYARNANGIRYGDNQKGVKLPVDKAGAGQPKLFSDSDLHFGERYTAGRYGWPPNAENAYSSSNPLVAMMTLCNYYRAPMWAEGRAVAAAQSRGRQAKPRASSSSRQSSASSRSSGGKTVAGQSEKNREKDKKNKKDKARKGKSRSKKTGSGASAPYPEVDFARVHSFPAGSRPPERMEEYKKLKQAAEKLVVEAGLANKGFDDPSEDKAEWIERCSAAMGLPKDDFFECSDAEKLYSRKDDIRRSILESRPVAIVRQSLPMTPDESVVWPLDIAFIDGFGFDEDTFHVVFPCGTDRGRRNVLSDYMKLEDLLHRAEAAVLIFVKP